MWPTNTECDESGKDLPRSKDDMYFLKHRSKMWPCLTLLLCSTLMASCSKDDDCSDGADCDETAAAETRLPKQAWYYCYGISKDVAWDCSEERDDQKIRAIQTPIADDTGQARLRGLLNEPAGETAPIKPPVEPAAPALEPKKAQQAETEPNDDP